MSRARLPGDRTVGGPVSYQLLIELKRPAAIRIGALGRHRFPAGLYVYTGSARRNMEARLCRHRSRAKTLRWHIDYFLAHPASHLVGIERSAIPECALNQQTRGEVIVRGFGSSDCRAGCDSHLLFMGTLS